jgi:hypothetical protein
MAARKFGGSVAREYRAIYGHLLSGDKKQIRQFRKVIEDHRLMLNALDATDRVKRWINQDTDDPDTRPLKFLEDTFKLAEDPGDHLESEQRWIYRGRTARALFYCGRFHKARNRFRNATRSKPREKANLREFYDIHAAFAEMEAYLGFPEDAIARIESIPVGRRQSWHNWVRAFAMHQDAYRKVRRFGTTVDLDVNGDRNDYYQSNNLLEANIPGLAPQEQRDCYLLIAANYGAMFRIDGRSSDRDDARAAMRSFKAAARPSSNRNWSFRKELRGRFPTIRLPGDPGRHSKEDIENWRAAYLNHYRLNLLAAGLDETADDDGAIDTVEEHPDDSGD